MAQCPPAKFKGNVCAAQKSLPGSANPDLAGENYELGAEKSVG
jgi:hypothetical protein